MEKTRNLKTFILFVLVAAMIFTSMSIGMPMVKAADECTHERNTYGYCELCDADIKGANMTIGQDLSLNYYAFLADAYKDATMHFVMSNGKEAEVNGVYDANSGFYKFVLDKIPPQTMGDTINATLMLNETILDEYNGYSVKAYAQSQLKKYPNDAELKQLLTDMLYYGEAAQIYRDYETDALITSGVTGLCNPSGVLPTESGMVYEPIEGTTARFTSAGVWFDYNNRLYIKLNTTEDITVKVNGENVTLDGTTYETGGISATNFDKVYTFELYEGEILANRVEYSIKAYVYNTMNKTGEDGQLTNMAKLARALYAYGKAAEAYKAAGSSDNGIVGENSTTVTVLPTDDNRVSTAISMFTDDGMITAEVPAGVLLETGIDTLTLSVNDVANSNADISLSQTESAFSINVHIDGISADNDVVMKISIKELLPIGLNIGNYRFYHVENGETVEMILLADGATPVHNNYEYDPATGDVVLYLNSFSEIALVADDVNAWNGKYDYTWYDADETELTISNADQLAAFGAIVGGMNGQTKDSFTDKTVKLLADINLGDAETSNNSDIIFYPIGYYNSTGSYEKISGGSVTSNVNPFEGTFDGNGNTISNFYQNTWEMFGDYNSGYTGTPNHYKDAMGLFGYVLNGTVKNLTVDNFSSDGEFTPTGVIAAYAVNSIFENIAITNCNPRVYNTGNGGIVGIAGESNDTANEKLTFTNITVDNTNKISALWGSWDVACGGLVGMFRGNVDSNGNATGDTIHFENCHVAAQIDVYNDVCANYQYYAYRYAGMIIGSIRHNTTNEEGKTIPNMKGISATGCTVNYGTWNDYYYCEFEKNSIASYSEDYQFSRVPHSELNFTDSNNNGIIDTEDERKSVTGCKHEHTDAEDKQAIYLPFHQLFTGYSWGVSSIGLEKYSGIVTNLDIIEGDQNESVEKFKSKFTGDFLYRVGNQNTVALGSLFGEAKDVTIDMSGFYVSIENIAGNATGTVSTTETDWTKRIIQFTGTGIVKVTIQDYNYCTPTELYLEVVDAVNATSAASATKNNVVLLNDCGFSSLEVSGGYTLYGNGFTMTCSSDSYATDRTYSFVDLKGGTLDNVQIVVPNFSHAIIYEKNKTENGNSSFTDSAGKTRYYNIRSAVLVSATSKITNSYISGGRVAIYATSGELTIDNSTILGGAVANIQAEASCQLILKDATLIQKPIQANVNDTSKTLMGLSVLLMCDTSGNGAPVTLQGYLHQYAWANSDYKQYVPSDAQSVVDEVLDNSDYIHRITYDDGVTRDSVNLGFAYMPDGLTETKANNMTDNRSDLGNVPYDKVTVNNLAMIYTYKSTNGTDDAVKTEPAYTADTQGGIIPTVKYEDVNESRVFTTTYDATKAQWKSTLKVDVDAGEYSFSFAKLLAQKYGTNLSYTVKTENGTGVDKNATITLNSAVSNVYVLTITDDQIYDKNGNLTNETSEITYMFELLSTKTSLPAPTWTSTMLNGTPYIVVDTNGSDWNCAVPVLDGLKVKYWSKKQNQEIELDLADVVTAAGLSSGLQNGSNNTITIIVADEYTLTVTTTGFKTNDNGKPVVLNDKLYFTVSSSSNYVSTKTTEREVSISYVFTDANNSDSIKLSTNMIVGYDDYKSSQYKYSDFCNGTLTSASNGECVTPDTLITLANGTQARVDSLTGSEELLVWNMETGKLDTAPIMFVDSDPEAEYEIVHLYFSDGTDVKIIYEHGFWDYDLNKYVYLDANASAYIGHTFAKQNGDTLEKVELVDVVIEKEITTAWSPVTANHLCYFVNGMLSMPGGVGGLFNIFDVDADTMTYDYEAMQKDIEAYGLYTYEELNAICPLSEDMFNAAGGAYLKISIAKGNLTEDELIYMINRYSKFFE